MLSQRCLAGLARRPQLQCAFFSAHAKPVTPDCTTTVEVSQHKLTRPVRGKQSTPTLRRKQIKQKVSLIPETLKEMMEDEEFLLTVAALKKKGQKKLTREEKKKRARALDNLGVPSFSEFITKEGSASKRIPASVFQVNIGLYCNQACTHCHVESSPKRTEMMDEATVDRCLEIISNSPSIQTVDITGGAPELNTNFRRLVKGARALGKEVIDRCNLTVLSEPGQEDLADFLAENKVRVVASLPCYSAKNVNNQRGSGVFGRSISGLLELNERGYGTTPELNLDLVYNPIGAFLPPDQVALKQKYKEELAELFDIHFNDLFTVTNMPIKRFADFLYRRGELEEYMSLLVRNFNMDTIEGMMCTNHVNVSWDGQMYDCDFNQQLDMPAEIKSKQLTVFDVNSTAELEQIAIKHDSHCFGCTAGAGSS